MFVMTNHGGLPEEPNIYHTSTAQIFVQRAFLLEILSQCGLSVVLFEGAEYRDAKVILTP